MTGAPAKPEFATNRPNERVADAINAHLNHLRETWAQPPDLAISTAYFNPAGFLLLALGEAGALAVAVALLLLGNAAGSLQFQAIKAAAVSLAPGLAWAVFLLAFFGFPTKLMFAATALAVSGLPSEQVTPLRSVKVAVVLLPDHFEARFDSIWPDDVKLISES